MTKNKGEILLQCLMSHQQINSIQLTLLLTKLMFYLLMRQLKFVSTSICFMEKSIYFIIILPNNIRIKLFLLFFHRAKKKNNAPKQDHVYNKGLV